MTSAPKSKWRHIADVLRSDIERGIFSVGDQLPTVLMLSQRFNVNRHTVRKALETLQQSGLVSMQQGRGTYVSDTSVSFAPEFRLCMELGHEERLFSALSKHEAVEAEVLSSENQLAGVEHAALLGCSADDNLVKSTILLKSNGSPLCLSEHLFLARQVPQLTEALKATNGFIYEALQFIGYQLEKHQRVSIQATTATPRQADLLGIKTSLPILATLGLDYWLEGDSKTPLHFYRLFWPSKAIYVRQSREVSLAT